MSSGTRRPSHLVIAAIVVGLLLPASVLAVTPVRAADPTYTGAVISDEGGGISRTLEASVDSDPGEITGTFRIEESFEAVEIYAGGYRFRFSSGPDPFEVGPYNDLLDINNSASPGLSVELVGRGCGRAGGTGGSFNLIETPLADADGNLVRFAADLRYRCSFYQPQADEPGGWLHASIRVGAATAPSVIASPLSVDVPPTVVGESTTVTVDLPNMGRGLIQVGDVSLSGSDAEMFSIVRDGCSGATVAGETTCSIDITFEPTTTQARDALITVAAGPTHYPHAFSVNSVGVSPILRLPSSMLVYGEPGGWLLDGIARLSSGSDVTGGGPGGDGRGAGVGGLGGDVSFYVEGPEPLELRRYEDTWAFEVPLAAISASMDGHGCNWAVGWFDILELPVYDIDGSLLSVAFDFEHHCEGAPEALVGSVRFHSTVPLTDVAPPSGTVEIASGADATTTTAVTLSTAATDLGAGVNQVALSNDGSTWTTRAYAATQPWALPAINGTRTVHVKWGDAASNWSEVKTDTIVLNMNAPAGTVSIAAGAAYTNTNLVSVATAATHSGSGLSQVALSNDRAEWTTRPYAASQVWALPTTNGTQTVYVKWKDGAGNWSAVVSDTIVLDTVAATVTAPRRGFVAPSELSAGKIALRVPWSGSDATSGIAHYELAQSTDGGAWTTVSTTLTSPTATRSLAPLHAYRFRVRAIDKAGNVGAWVTGATFGISRYSEFNPAIRYGGSWTNVSSPAYLGGAARKTTAAGARASLTFSGRSIAWVARTGPDRGKAAIYLNGTKVATVDLYSATPGAQRVVWVGTWTTAASRTVSIRNAGTPGRPRIDLDALITAN